MAIAYYPNAKELVTAVLTCDPDIENNNAPELLASYLDDGDINAIEAPASATKFMLRPLTTAQLGACNRTAGRPSVLGDKIKKELTATAVAEIERAILVEGTEADGDTPAVPALTEEEIAALEPLIGRTEVDLTDDEYTALRASADWDTRFRRAIVDHGVFRADGWPEGFDIEAVLPLDLQRTVEGELFGHIVRISHLSDEGKELSA